MACLSQAHRKRVRYPLLVHLHDGHCFILQFANALNGRETTSAFDLQHLLSFSLCLPAVEVGHLHERRLEGGGEEEKSENERREMR